MTMEESTRNALLRRVDWRLLLGIRRVGTAATRAGDDLTRAVAAIADRQVPLGAEREPCDLVVLSNPDAGALDAAYEALREGGHCLCEYGVAVPGAGRRARRRLEAAGFRGVRCYWAWPRPGRLPPRFWLPLDAPGALRHFAATRPPAGGRLTVVALRSIWRLAARLALLPPTCAMGSKPPAVGEGTLADSLRARWEGWALGPAPEEITCSMETGGRRSVNKAVVLVFADAEERPRMAVKLARVPESEPGLEREARALRALPSGSPPGVQVPELIFHERLGGNLASGLSAVEGRPVSTVLDLGAYRGYAQRVTDFLVHLVGEVDAAPRDEWRARLVEPVLSRFDAMFGPVLRPGELELARARLAALPQLPPAFEQRDLSPWNVLVAPGGRLSILDWESAEPHGLPALDLVYFLTYGALFLEGTMDSGQETLTYSRMLDAASPAGEVHRDCVERYVEATGVDSAALPALRILLWMIHADSEYERFTADAGGRPGGAALAASVCLRLWREELARAGGAAAAPPR